MVNFLKEKRIVGLLIEKQMELLISVFRPFIVIHMLRIQKAVEESDTLDEVFDHFDSKLGNVADGIARVCYAKKREKELNG